MANSKNSEQFLSTFNELEKHFKNKFFRGSWKSFKQMLKEGSRNNPIIWQFKEELFEFTDLRNAIVHNRNHNYQVIAEPHDFIVKRFSDISKQIISPKKVSSFFKPVHTCQLTDSVDVPLKIINENHISQIPVLDHELKTIDILSANTICYWLTDNKDKLSNNYRVADILKYKEYEGNYEFIKATTTVYHAAEIYRKSYLSQPKNKYYNALLITQNGLPTEKLKGIIVLSDIADYI